MSRFLLPLLLCACPNPAGTDPQVDETGYLNADQVWYSARQRLDGPAEISLFGLDGAFEPGGGELVVEGADQPLDPVSVTAGGAFRVDLVADAATELSFRYTPPQLDAETTTFVLADDLGAVEPPGIASQSILAPGTGGEVTVDFSALAGGAPPWIAFNRTSDGLGVQSPAGDPVTLAAVAGDEVCVFSLAPANARQSTYACEFVP